MYLRRSVSARNILAIGFEFTHILLVSPWLHHAFAWSTPIDRPTLPLIPRDRLLRHESSEGLVSLLRLLRISAKRLILRLRGQTEANSQMNEHHDPPSSYCMHERTHHYESYIHFGLSLNDSPESSSNAACTFDRSSATARLITQAWDRPSFERLLILRAENVGTVCSDTVYHTHSRVPTTLEL